MLSCLVLSWLGLRRLPRARSARGAASIEMALVCVCLIVGAGLGIRALGVRVCGAASDARHAVSPQRNIERDVSLEAYDPPPGQR